MIDNFRQGQDSPLKINESSFAMKNRENLKNPQLLQMEAEERAINQILGKPNNSALQTSSKLAKQLKRLKWKSKAVQKGKGGRPLLTKHKPKFEVKRVRRLKEILVKNQTKSGPIFKKTVKSVKTKLRHQNQEIIGKNRQRKGKHPKVNLEFIRKKKIQAKKRK